MSYLLDTCVISECVKRKPDLQVKAWFNQQSKEQLFLSVITIAEIKKGIYKKKPSQPERALKEFITCLRHTGCDSYVLLVLAFKTEKSVVKLEI